MSNFSHRCRWAVASALLALLSAPLANTANAQWQAPAKKLIHAGAGPSLDDLQHRMQELERLPFDGLMVRTPLSAYGFPHERKWSDDEVQPILDQLRAIRWNRFTDNFLMVKPADTQSDMDWFNDEHWENIEYNMNLVARMAADAHCVGICLDPEQYNSHPWDYSKAAHHDTIGFEEYCAQVRRRGAQYMSSLQSVMPKIKILNYFQLSRYQKFLKLPEHTTENTQADLSAEHYGLYAAFINGMLDVASPETRFIDGNEVAYYYTTKEEFDAAYAEIMQRYLFLVAPENREKYKSIVQVGSAIYMDQIFALRADPANALGSFLTPELQLQLLRHNVFQSLDSVDEYVWCYSETRTVNWWSGKVPAGAIDAIEWAKAAVNMREKPTFPVADFRDAVARQRTYEQDTRNSLAPPKINVPKLGSAVSPTIDGQLDDPIWQHAAKTSAFVPRGQEMRTEAFEETVAMIAWDDQNLYVAFSCDESNVKAIHASGKQRDDDFSRGDAVELFIGPNPDGGYFHLMFNPKNLQWDGLMAEGQHDASWNAEWQSAAVIADGRWTAELVLPWNEFGGVPVSGETRKANFTRTRNQSPGDETTSWARVYRLHSDTHYFGTLTFND